MLGWSYLVRGVFIFGDLKKIILTLLCYSRCIKSGWGLLKVKVNLSYKF